MDWYWVHTCTYDKPLRYSDFNFGREVRKDPEAIRHQQDWLGTTKERLNKHIAEDCDGIITGLYEYWACYHLAFPAKTTFIPFPIRMPESSSTERAQSSKVVIFIGINRERSVYKGTDIMLRAAEDVQSKYPHRMKLLIAESVPFEQYRHMMEGSDAILEGIRDGEMSEEARGLVDRMLKTHFRPEFLNRIDEIVYYKPLTRTEIAEIVNLMVKALNERLAEKQLKVELTDAAMEALINRGFDPVYGARPLKRYLQSHIETLLARRIIAADVEPGSALKVDLDENGEFTIRN